MTWPARPDDRVSNLEHALLYHRLPLGLWVLPGRDEQDIAEYREGLRRKYAREGATPEDAAVRAAAKADRARKHTFVQWRKLITRPTEDDLIGWFGSRPLRPVVLLTGPGHGTCVVDVDPDKGGDEVPWVGVPISVRPCPTCGSTDDDHETGCDDMTSRVVTGEAPTLVALTPREGWHAYHLEVDVATSEGQVADGVDVRGRGGLVVAPSGQRATPGRRWVRWGEPSPFPLEEVTRRLVERVATSALASAGCPPGTVAAAVEGRGFNLLAADAAADREYVPDGPPGPERAFSHAMLSPAPDGTKNPRAKTLIGMLARGAPLPEDAREAVLRTLGEWRERLALRGPSADVVRAAHEQQAAAAERTPAFALEVLLAWNELRASPRWPRDKVEDVAASLWRSARAREDGRVRPVRGDGEDDAGAAGGEGQGAAGDDVLAAFLPPLGSLYGPDSLGADLRRELLSCARLPLWLGPDGEPDRTSPHGHGLGEQFDEVLGGGLSPKYMAVVGAESAKNGKSALVFQVAVGHALRSALVLSGALSGPVVVPYVLSEMNPAALTWRDLGRWLGVDSNLFRRGRDRAHTAPGLRRLAERIGREPRSLAAEFLARADLALREGPLARARELITIVQTRALKGPEDHEGPGRPRDHRRGVLLLSHLAEAVRRDRARKAKAWGRTEDQILPLILIDPMQRYQREGDGDAVGALDELVEEARHVADEDELVVIATSDTQKDSAKGLQNRGRMTPFQLAAHVFRGSYKLLHLPDLALVLRVEWPEVPGTPARASLQAALNRWGIPQATPAEYDFWPETGRYQAAAPAQDEAPAEEAQRVEREPEEAPPPRLRGRFARRSPGEGVPG